MEYMFVILYALFFKNLACSFFKKCLLFIHHPTEYTKNIQIQKQTDTLVHKKNRNLCFYINKKNHNMVIFLKPTDVYIPLRAF